MSNLKTAFNIVWKQAKKQKEAGEIPLVLGTRGLLALMHDRINQFAKHEDEQTNYLLDLAVKAMFAFAVALPSEEDFDVDDIQDSGQEQSMEEPDESSESPSDEQSDNDPRWTPVAPNTPLPTVAPVRRSVMDDSTEP